jgi:acetyl esterase/lipase
MACAGLVACSSGSGTSSTSAGTSVVGSRAATSSKISFVVDGTTTYGTLEVPAHRSGQHFAAALLIAGSGPTDRNGNDVGLHVTPDTLQLVANTLASEGIMSLRFDKYFAGETGAGRLASNPGAFTLDTFLEQAAEAYTFLRAQPATDPTRMLIVGHSEGGMYALVLARRVSPKPAGLALLEPQDTRVLDLVGIQTDENIAALVAQGNLTQSEGTTNEQLVRQAIADFRAGRPVSTAGMAQSVIELITPELLNTGNARYIRSDDATIPAQYAAALPSSTQILFTDGTRDPNVPPSTVGPLRQALATAKVAGPGFRLLQGTDHYLHLASQPDNEPVLAPAAVAAIKQWAQPFASSS